MGLNGALTVLEQGSAGEIAQSVGLLLSTRPGDRKAVPGYGLPQPLGAGVTADQVVDVVTAWEHRATDVDVDGAITAMAQVVRVSLTQEGATR